MTAIVLDCTVAMSWILEDETAPETEILLDRVTADGAVVPGIWQLEIANVMLQAQKRTRLDNSMIEEGLRLLENLPILTDQETSQRGVREILRHARPHGLTAYDAAYLELAARIGSPLATLDKRLAEAAGTSGVEVLPS